MSPQIVPHPAVTVVLLLLFVYWIVRGRVEIFMGVFLALNHSTRSLMFFGVSHIWVLVLSITLAGAVFWLRNPRLELKGYRYRWIIPWMLFWWFWQLLLIYTYRNFGFSFIFLVTDLILIGVMLLLIGKDLDRVRIFAIAYVATAVTGGVLALLWALGGRSLSYFLVDPTLQRIVSYQYLSSNYHFFALPFVVSFVLSWILFEESRLVWRRILFALVMAFCGYQLLLTGSRHSLISVGVVIILLALRYFFFAKGASRYVYMIAIAGLLVLVWQFYAVDPQAFLREQTGRSSVTGTIWLAVLDRIQLSMAPTWRVFVASPIWGTGFRYLFAHNLILAVMAEQGLVGLVFFLGWMLFAAKVIRDVFRQEDSPSLVWQQGMVLITVTVLVAGLVDLSTTSAWHLFWSMIIAWSLQSQLPLRGEVPELSGGQRRGASSGRALAVPNLRRAQVKRERPDA